MAGRRGYLRSLPRPRLVPSPGGCGRDHRITQNSLNERTNNLTRSGLPATRDRGKRAAGVRSFGSMEIQASGRIAEGEQTVGGFSHIRVLDLRVEGYEINQATDVFDFDNPVFVSWDKTDESPRPDDGWLWLAGNTMRLAGKRKSSGHHHYLSQPVDEQLNYHTVWPTDGEPLLVHLALPPNFVPSSMQSTPSYVKFDRKSDLFRLVHATRSSRHPF